MLPRWKTKLRELSKAAGWNNETQIERDPVWDLSEVGRWGMGDGVSLKSDLRALTIYLHRYLGSSEHQHCPCVTHKP